MRRSFDQILPRLIFLLTLSVSTLAFGHSRNACPADFDGNGLVDGADLSYLLSGWGPCPTVYCEEDLDGDGLISGTDLARLLSAWGPTGTDCIPGPSSDRFTANPIGTTYGPQGFWEYLPHQYDQRDSWPLIVFLHGIGSNGNGSASDLQRITGNGPARIISENQWPVEASATGDQFIVLAPQNSNGDSCHVASDIDAFLRWAIATYKVDPTRVYLTGLSCGGIGTWNYIREYFEDDVLAASIPICGIGIGTWDTHQCDLGQLPLWGFHGDADDVISVYGTYIPLTSLLKCTSPPPVDARLTIYPGVGHDSWTQTYNLQAGYDIYAWLLSHTNPDAGQ